MHFKNEIKISKRDCTIEIEQKYFGETHTVSLTAGNARELLVWLKKEMPDAMRDVMCEDCPEHLVQQETADYHANESERGHKHR